jgi:hypothetical protein
LWPDVQFNRSFSLSEIYAIFPEPNSSRAQIEFSSLVQAMLKHPKGEMHILMRLVTEDGLPPKLCIGKAIEEDGVGREYMVITKVRLRPTLLIRFLKGCIVTSSKLTSLSLAGEDAVRG